MSLSVCYQWMSRHSTCFVGNCAQQMFLRYFTCFAIWNSATSTQINGISRISRPVVPMRRTVAASRADWRQTLTAVVGAVPSCSHGPLCWFSELELVVCAIQVILGAHTAIGTKLARHAWCKTFCVKLGKVARRWAGVCFFEIITRAAFTRFTGGNMNHGGHHFYLFFRCEGK